MQFLHRANLVAFSLFTILLAVNSLTAQSTNQSYPTLVTSNEISGSIKARDIGDSRLTSYYYQLDSGQGDLFINIVTRNFTGDIDLFAASGLRPLTKIVVYADLAESETGRVIYLRKPERMLLRVQGRTPGDDPATFRIKFAGSFIASTQEQAPAEPDLPSLTAKNESGIRVNSVGTIVEIIPKATPTPAPVETVAEVTDEKAQVPEAEKSKTETKPDEPATEPSKKVEVVVTENIPPKTESGPPAAGTARRTARGRRRTPPKTTPPVEDPAPATETAAAKPPPARRRRGAVPPKTTEPPAPDPLEKVNLVIQFKDGSTIERPMSQVLRFTVDKGVLTVIAKDGSIGRYSILDVAKVTIE